MADLQIKALIEILLKGGNLTDEQRLRLQKLGDEATAAGTKLSLLQRIAQGVRGAFASLATTVGGVLAPLAAFRVAMTAFTEFAKTERQWAGIAAAIRGLGDESGAMAAKAREGIEALSEATGIVDDELIPAFGRLVRATKDVDAAQELLRISAVQAANGIGTVESNADALANALLSGTTRGLKEFGIQTGSAAKGGTQLADAIKQISAATDEMAPKMDDAQAKIDTLAQKWDQAKDGIGSSINSLINQVLRLEAAVNAATGGAVSATGLSNVQKALDVLSGKAGTPVASTADKAAEDAKRREALAKVAANRQAQIDKDANEETVRSREEMYDKMREAADKFWEEQRQNAEREVQDVKDAQARLAATRAQGARQGSAEELQARIDAINSASEAEIQKAGQNTQLIKTLELQRAAEIANARAAFDDAQHARELEAARNQIEAEIELEERALEADSANKIEHLDRLAQLERDLLALQQQEELDGLEGLEEQKSRLKETYALLNAQRDLEINQQKLDLIAQQELESLQLAVEGSERNSQQEYEARKALITKQYDDRLKGVQKGTKDELNLNRAKELALRDLQTQTVANQVSMYASAAGQILGALQGIFGEHKAFAIAEAIINVAQGISRAFADFPYPVAVGVSAAIAALGAVQIAKIASTNPGSTGAPTAGAGGSISASGGGSGRTSRPSGERPPRSAPSTAEESRFAGSTAGAATTTPSERERGTRQVTVINNDNRQTTYAPSNNVTLAGVVAATRTQLLKDLHRGLARTERTHIRRGRVNG